MPTTLTPAALKAFFDADPDRFKSGDDAGEDGYLPTGTLANLLYAFTVIDNPQPRGQIRVRARTTTEEFLAAAAAVVQVMPDSLLPTFVQAAQGLDDASLSAILSTLRIRGTVTEEQQDATLALLYDTIDDPNWSAKIQGPTILASTFVDDAGEAVRRLDEDVINAALDRPFKAVREGELALAQAEQALQDLRSNGSHPSVIAALERAVAQKSQDLDSAVANSAAKLDQLTVEVK